MSFQHQANIIMTLIQEAVCFVYNIAHYLLRPAPKLTNLLIKVENTNTDQKGVGMAVNNTDTW